MNDYLANFQESPFWLALMSVSLSALLSVILGLVARKVIMRVVRLADLDEEDVFYHSFRHHLRKPLGMLLPLAIFFVSLSFIEVAENVFELDWLIKTVQVLLFVAVGWAMMRALNVAQDYVHREYSLDDDNNLSARKVRTQTQFIKKLGNIIVVILVASAILMSFERVRQFGTGLLTSAGVTGIIIGFAAQRSIANLIAGFQIAFTQPIRIDDVVIVEGEWGRVEEITLTYVVVRIWDKRRLILPITHFIEKPFQNWTRISADIIGTVYFYTDYTVPLEPLREELDRLVEGNELWDGAVKVLQVTNLTDRTMELRALVSADASGKAWDLRCYVREQMMHFIQKNYPESLPRTRAFLTREEHPTQNGQTSRPQKSPRPEEGKTEMPPPEV